MGDAARSAGHPGAGFARRASPTHLAAIAGAGAGHVQLVADPITLSSIERPAEALAILDAAG